MFRESGEVGMTKKAGTSGVGGAHSRHGKTMWRKSLVVALALLMFVGPTAWAWSQSPASGPLDPHWPLGGTSTGFPVEHHGAIFTFASFALRNHGDRSVTVDRVELIPAPGWLPVTLVRGFIAHPTGRVEFASVTGPPQKQYAQLRPARGSVIPPHTKTKHILALEVAPTAEFYRAPRLDFAVARGIKVFYHSGPHRYVDIWGSQIVLCHGSCGQFSWREMPPLAGS